MKFLNILICVSICIQYSNAKVHLCDVETGQTNIILDIEESRGEREFHCRILVVNKFTLYYL